MPRSSSFICGHPPVPRSLSLWERAGVRDRSLREEKRKRISFVLAVSPHPNPLPPGEGTAHHSSLITHHAHAGRVRLTSLLALGALLLALCALPFIARARAAAPGARSQGSGVGLSFSGLRRPTPGSLYWISDRAWMHQSSDGSSPFALSPLPLALCALVFSDVIPMHPRFLLRAVASFKENVLV